MNNDEYAPFDCDDGTEIADLLERAEHSLRIKDDKKYYITRNEAILLAQQPDLDMKTRIEKDCGGNWVIEIYYSKMVFIHATSCQTFVGQSVQ